MTTENYNQSVVSALHSVAVRIDRSINNFFFIFYFVRVVPFNIALLRTFEQQQP